MRLADDDETGEALSRHSSRPLYTPTVEAKGPVPRRWFKIAIIVILIAGLGLAAQAVTRYQPLEQGSTAQKPQGSTHVTDDFSSSSDVPKVLVPYHDGAENSFAFSVRNGGRWGVTLTDLPVLRGRSEHILFKITKAEMSDATGTTGPFRPFRPVSLAPHDEVLIRLTGVFTDCEWFSPASSNAINFITVRFRYLGLTRTAYVYLPFEIEVQSPPVDQCPREPRYN